MHLLREKGEKRRPLRPRCKKRTSSREFTRWARSSATSGRRGKKKIRSKKKERAVERDYQKGGPCQWRRKFAYEKREGNNSQATNGENSPMPARRRKRRIHPIKRIPETTSVTTRSLGVADPRPRREDGRYAFCLLWGSSNLYPKGNEVSDDTSQGEQRGRGKEESLAGPRIPHL